MNSIGRHPRHFDRRGTAYVFVLGVCLLITVLGMGTVTVSRLSLRAVTGGNDWETAGTLAQSATEHAISVLNAAAAASPTTWRGAYASGQTAFSKAMGRGTMSWTLKDETDGNLSADYLRAFRLYGIGRVGGVTRVYSVQVVPGGSPLDVLRTAMHGDANVTLTGTTRAANGPISGNANVSLSGKVDGSIEAQTTSGSATGTQSITAPAAKKRMPSAGVYDQLLQSATAIGYASLGGKIEKCLLSATSNPYGATNADGIYSVTVPDGKELNLSKCRIVGTLLVNGSNIAVKFKGPVEFEPGAAGRPSLVVSGGSAEVAFEGSDTWLSEASAGVNFNPAGTPYAGNTNTTKTDDIPPQYGGILHVIAGSGGLVSLAKNTYVAGTLIADCPIKTADVTTFVQDPTILANPPAGYATGDAMTEVPGSWRWDTLP